ncbi:MAG: 16S rRNA (guanine(527)-N(7))-methyltransferase RsmG [Jatrophihabitantaceae bacterium]
MTDSAPAESGVEPPPQAVAAVFGSRLGLAMRYAELLCGAGVVRGVIGPAESARIWSRHLLNCAAVTELFDQGARVVDVGSGAGLPGIAIALRRPDLRVDLVEPLQRRVAFLTDAVIELGLAAQVRIVRGRAEERATRDVVGQADWITARAVAPLDRLVRWCLPLLATSGRLALLKGASVGDEIEQHRAAMARAGAVNPQLVRCGAGLIEPPVTVVTLDVATPRLTRKGK